MKNRRASDRKNFAGMDFTFAFHPIVDTQERAAISHEALIRGINNEPAYTVLYGYRGSDLDTFDALCRARAIEIASKVGIDTHLNLNILPSAAMNVVAGLNSTIEAAERYEFPLKRIIIEVTEVHAIADPARFASVLNEYRRAGLQLAIDDFGAGYAGLTLLSEFQPDIVKLDMGLVRGIQSDGPRQAIVRAIWQVCIDLGIDFLVEGVETIDEFAWFTNLGAHIYQGYLFAKPLLEGMPAINFPTTSNDAYSIPAGQSLFSPDREIWTN